MFKIGFLIGLAIFLLVIMPFAGIWALNVLFPALAIPYTLETWFAALLVKGFITANVTVKK